MAKIQGNPRFFALKDDGSFAAGWKLYTMSAGTTALLDSYSDQAQTTPNANPIVLDGSGSADIWLAANTAYKLVLTDESDVTQWTEDNINTADSLSVPSLTVSGTATVGTLAVSSTSKVANLNADLLDGSDWANPASLGSSTPNAGAFTTINASGIITALAKIVRQSANGATATIGEISEVITLSTSGTTTDSTTNLLPANSLLLGAVARVITSITTATDWKLGDGTTAARFCAAQSGTQLNANSVALAIDQWKGGVSTDAAGPTQFSDAKLRITTTGTPTAGSIRVTMFYLQFGSPTS